MPTKTARMDYNKLLHSTSNKGGEAMFCCFKEEEEKTRGARTNLFINESPF